MSPAEAAAAGHGTCAACGLVCEDIGRAGDPLAGGCETGARELARVANGDESAWAGGRPLARAAAVAAAATSLASARRVLVTGFGGATLEAVLRACDVAEAVDAAIDAGLAESDRPAGPTIARAGEVTADWEELRDRADLVIFWRCDPSATFPRFVERFIAPPPAGGSRRVLVVGDPWPAARGIACEHVPLDAAAGIDAALEIQTILGGRHLPPPRSRAEAAPAAAAERITAAIDAARCVAIVTAAGDGDDGVGLEEWSLAHMVRTIAHVKPAFAIPLGGGGPAGGRAAAAVCTWRYGAPGAIDRAAAGIDAADAAPGRPPGVRPGERVFLPGESSARRLVTRGEVDAVLVIGRATAAVEAALTAARPPVVIRIDDVHPGAATEHATIRLACASLVAETAGTMLRGDGRTVKLVPVRAPRLPLLAEVLGDLLAVIRVREPGDEAGAAGFGRPAAGAPR